jgi:phosphoserine aminotransferase
MAKRIFNFSAGPSMLPENVLKRAAEEITDYQDSGMSVMEMSHRSSQFKKIAADAESNLRQLMNIPDEYAVLFLQGGATLQFSMVPINLLTGSGKADYALTGSFAKKAYKEAKKFGDVVACTSSEDQNFTNIPELNVGLVRQDADYVHITYNNTIYGTHYPATPEVGKPVLVADVSSCILGEQIDVSKYGLLYAGAQKNIGPAGLTIVIVKKELIGKAPETTPVYLDYKEHEANDSMYNTPPAWSIYIAGEVFKELIAKGGVEVAEARNRARAAKLYAAIDESKIFTAPAVGDARSLMNAVFVTGDAELDKKFVSEAATEGLNGLAGHRSVGGMRASIYNAMPDEGVEKLIEFIKKFDESN